MDSLILKTFDSDNESKFPKYNLDLWVEEPKFKDFLRMLNRDDTSPVYVTIKSDEILKNFTIHTGLQSLNPKSDLSKNSIYISKDVRHKDWLMDDSTKVTVLPINETELTEAEVVTIKLNNQEVENWSEAESGFAANNFKVHNKIAYKSQIVWLNPATKKHTIAEVVNVIPTPKKEFNTPLIVTDKTKVLFEGLPENQQTVIDFSKIGGLDSLIVKLREIIQIPLQYPEVLSRFSIKPPKGLLLYGPPGNGKTMIARAVSYSMGAKFISIEGPELMSKYVGVAESQLREKFEEAEQLGDCVIFIDEIDSVASSRENTTAEHQISIVSTLLNLMDGIKPRSKVFVIGATNRLNSLDPALRRPGRFDLEFEVPVPNFDARLDILSKYIDSSNKNLIDDSVDESFVKILSEVTNGYSGADIFSLYRESVMNAITENLKFNSNTGKIQLKTKEIERIRLNKNNFIRALKEITPTSLRGVDSNNNIVEWNHIFNLADQRRELENINKAVVQNIDDPISTARPGLFNILVKGKPGTGRKTTIRSFASKFNYELLNIDLLNLSSLLQQDSFLNIESVFIKARQAAPSIIYISNVQASIASEIYIQKILAESFKLNIRHKVLLIVEIDSNKEIPKFLIGYKSFAKEIIFDLELSAAFLHHIFDIYKNRGVFRLNESAQTFAERSKNKTFGQIISELNDDLLRGV